MKAWIVACTLLAAAAAAAPIAAQDAPGGVASIYGKARGDGWQNWSWDTTELSVAVQGSQRTPIRVEAGPYHAPFDTTPYKTMSMLVQGAGDGGQTLRILAIVGGKPLDQAHPITLPAAGWMKVDLPLARIGAEGRQIDGLWVQNAGDPPIAPFHVTEVALR